MWSLTIILLVVFFVTLIGLLWDVSKDDEDLRDDIENDLCGWWEYFNAEDEEDDDDDEDKTINGDH